MGRVSTTGHRRGLSLALLRATGSVAVRPRLWSAAIRVAGRTAPNGWWRRAPFLPLPDRRYLAFRMQTQYGDQLPAHLGTDLVAYLEWCRLERRD